MNTQNTIRINIPVEISCYGDLPKDASMEELAKALCYSLSSSEDGRGHLAMECLQSLIASPELLKSMMESVICQEIATRNPLSKRRIETKIGKSTHYSSAAQIASEKRMKSSGVSFYIRVDADAIALCEESATK
jgi:hypothetical protein